MARPRKIDFKDGTILLNSFPKEVADKIEQYLLDFEKPQLVVAEPVMDASLDTTRTFKDKAIGLQKIDGRYEVIVVGYDKETKEAKVEEVKPAGDFKDHALSVFQQEIFKRGLI